jgi:VCBS repeat-containing protein
MVDAGSPAEGQSGPSSGEGPGDLQVAQATTAGAHGDAIGAVNQATGDAFIVHKDGTSEPAASGTAVYADDIVATGTDGAVEVIFKDGTTFSLGNNGQMRLDNLIYDPAGTNNGLDATIVKGSFVFITGNVGSAQGEGVSIDTPAGTIGIRGTSGGVVEEDGKWIFTLFRDPDGKLSHFTVTNPAGQQLLDQEFETTEVGGFHTPPAQTIVLSPAQAATLFSDALHLLSQQFPELQRSELENVNPAAGEDQYAIRPGHLPPSPGDLAAMFGMSALGEALLDLLGNDAGFDFGSEPAFVDSVQHLLPVLNSPLLLAADDGAVIEDTADSATGNVLDNDKDVQGGGVLAVSAVSAGNGDSVDPGEPVTGQFGTLVLQPDGSYVYDLNNDDQDVQALGEGQTATDKFTYTVTDGQGHTATATLTITVTGSNDQPEATDDTNAVPEDTSSASGNVLANDNDVDKGDVLTVSAVDGSTENVGAPIEGSYGTLQLNANGTYSYTLNDDSAAVQQLGEGQTATDSFTYTISDGHGGTATATLTITVTGTNDQPVAVADVNAVTEDTEPNPVSGNVLGNDSDVDNGDVLSVSAVNDGAGNVGEPLAGTYGTLQLNANGTYSYTLNNDSAAVQALAAGQTATDVFHYTVSDGHGGAATATLTITVTGTDDRPVAVPDTNAVTEDSGPNPVSGNVLANDSDVDAGDQLAVSAVNDSADNLGAPIAGTYGTLQLNADGSYSYTLDNEKSAVQALAEGQTATDVFSYTVSDGHGGGTTTTLTIAVTGTNDQPVAVADTNTVTEDTGPNPVSGNVLSNDTDIDATDQLAVSAVDDSADNVGTPVVGTYGTLQLNGDGTYSYTLDNGKSAVQALAAGQTATDVFHYAVSDGHGGTDEATLTITVVGTDDGPVAVPDTNAVTEDAEPNPVSGNVLANDSDVDTGDQLAVSAVNDDAGNVGATIAGTYGTLQLNADGSYSYALDNEKGAVQALAEDQTATDVFSYTVSDGHGGSTTSTLTITVTGTNDQPVAVADANTVTEDTAPNPVSGNVLSNDSDVDATDQLTVSAVTGGTVGEPIVGAYGTLQLNADGTYSYTLDNGKGAVQALAAGQTATDQFTYTVSDGHGGTDTTTLTITVVGTDDGPVAVPDTNAVTEDAAPNPVSGNVLGNDSDVDTDDQLAVSAVNGSAGNLGESISGSYGTLQLNADGSYSYTLDNEKVAVQALAEDQTATDVFSYTVSDGHGGSATSTLTITVTGTNDQPVAQADVNAVTEDTGSNPVSGNVLVNDSDVDATDHLTVSALAGGTVGEPIAGTYGTLQLNADGSYSYTLDNEKSAVQALAAGQTATDEFSYTISDGHGGTATTTLTITVTGTDDGPVAVPDANAVTEDAEPNPVSANVLANDSDADTGDQLTVSAVNGSAGDVGHSVDGTYGTLQLNTDGSYSYTLDNQKGAVQSLAEGQTATDEFSYTVSDGHGGSATSTLTITVTGSNDPPAAQADANAVTEDAQDPVSGNVLDNDTDVDATDQLTVSAVAGSVGNVGEPIDGTYGTLQLNADGSYSYTLDNEKGAVQALGAGQTAIDEFSYTVSDGHGGSATATLTITVAGTDDGPTAVADAATAQEDGPAVVIPVLANDTDPDANDSKTVSAIDTSHTLGHVTIAQDGSNVTYDPNGAFESLGAGETATDTFTYTVKDGSGETSTATVTVTIVGANDGPTAVDDKATVQQDGPAVAIAVLANDTDPDAHDTKTVLSVDTGETLGQVTIAPGGGGVSYDPNGAFESLGAGETATDTFTYTMKDGSGETSTATVTVTIVGANDAPTAADDTATAQEDGPPIAIAVLANDADPDANDGKTVLSVDTTETLGTVTIAPDGSDVSYDPNGTFQSLGEGETATDTFSYTMKDDSGATSTATVTVTIIGENDGPTANADQNAVAEDKAPNPVTGNVLANDSDPDAHDVLTVSAVNGSGNNVSEPISGTYGTLLLSDDGSYSYALDNSKAAVQGLKAGQTATDAFSYTISDGHGGTATASLTITVTGTNDPPVANDDKVKAAEDTPLTITAATLLGNDKDADGDPLKIASVGKAAHGTVTLSDDGSVTYTPDADYNGPDSFTYQASDGSVLSNVATVAIDIAPVNDPPVAVDDGPYETLENHPVSIALSDLLQNDSDIEHDPLTITGVQAVDGGAVQIVGDHVVFTPAQQFDGDAHFTYTVSDGNGGTDMATVTVHVADDKPVAVDDHATTADRTTQSINLIIVLDLSGSMGQDPGVAGFSTRLELARAAIAALLASHGSVADLHIEIVGFSDSATTSGWFDSVADANAYLAALAATGGTNYAAAIQAAMGVFNGAPADVLNADKTEVYFLSDGEPTKGDSLHEAGLVDDWEAFLAQHDVDKAFAVGIGGGLVANDPDLADVAYPNNDPSTLLVVTDESQLIHTLVATVANPVSGNVLDNDSFGADGKGNGGGGLLSLTVDGVTYTYSAGAITSDKAPPHPPQIDGATIIILTALGGSLEFDFDTGNYVYVPPDATGNEQENFTYVIEDHDGSTASGTLTIDITDKGTVETDPHPVIGQDGADSLIGSTGADIMSGGGGNDSISGGTGDDHIQGGAGKDTIDGGGGNDILIGGADADSLIGGDGSDAIVVGSGDNASGGGSDDLFILTESNSNFGGIHGGGDAVVDLATQHGDVLAFNGTLDLTKLANNLIDGIETISMADKLGGPGADTLSINAKDVIDVGTGQFNPAGNFGSFGELPDAPAIRVDGDSGDTLNLSDKGWQKVTTNVGVPDGYVLYVHDDPAIAGTTADAYVLVQSAVTVKSTTG